MNFSDFKSLVAALESIAKIIALAAAGWWTFVLFVKKREKYPRARTTHSLSLLGKIDGYRILRLAIKIENLGNVLIELRSGKVSIQVVRPLPDAWKAAILRGEVISRVDGREFPWPDLGDKFLFDWGESGYRIEPLESEEFHFDLTFAETIEVIQVYSYFKNVTETSKSWVGIVQLSRLFQEEMMVANKPQVPPAHRPLQGLPKPPGSQGPPKGPIRQGPPKQDQPRKGGK